MGLFGNGKAGRRGATPLLISIFWLISTFSATLSEGYFADRDTSFAATDAGSPIKNETRLAREVDNSSTPAQRPLRVAALETLHLKIKSGLRADASPQDGLLPPESQLPGFYKLASPTEQLGSSRLLDYNLSLNARAPPLAS